MSAQGGVFVSVILEAELSGAGVAWTNISRDLRMSYGISLQRGIRGSGPLDRVAEPGSLRAALDNSTHNSARLLGYYSPGHPNCRRGFDVGIRMRLRTVHRGVPKTQFVGTLDEVVPVAGTLRDRAVQLVVVDWLDEASLYKLTGLATQTNVRSDQILSTIIAAMPKQPVATSIDTGSDTWDYALDNAKDESSTALSEFQRIEQSELGLIYVKGDGTLRAENRHARALRSRNVETFDGTMRDVKVGRSRAEVYNRIRAVAHPRRVDSAATNVLYFLQSKPLIPLGVARTYFGGYVDPTTRASRVGGINMQPLIAGTDYTANTAEDGSGVDVTASFTVVPSFGGNGVSFLVTNAGTVDAYLTKLQARGRGLYDYENVMAEVNDSTSRDNYGQRVLTLDMFYQGDPAIPASAASWLLQTYKDPRSNAKTLSIIGNYSDERMRQALSLEISDRIGIIERVTGLNVSNGSSPTVFGYYINGVSMRIDMGNIVTTTYVLAPGYAFDYWILGIVGSSELGVTTRLGFV